MTLTRLWAVFRLLTYRSIYTRKLAVKLVLALVFVVSFFGLPEIIRATVKYNNDGLFDDPIFQSFAQDVVLMYLPIMLVTVLVPLLIFGTYWRRKPLSTRGQSSVVDKRLNPSIFLLITVTMLYVSMLQFVVWSVMDNLGIKTDVSVANTFTYLQPVLDPLLLLCFIPGVRGEAMKFLNIRKGRQMRAVAVL